MEKNVTSPQLFSDCISRISHCLVRIESTIASLIADGKLLRGKSREKYEWIGVVLVERMTRCWLQAAINDGCQSWNVVIHKALTVVLQSALCCRASEIALSPGYTTEHLKWADLAMKLPVGKVSVDDIELTYTIKYEKGYKREQTVNRTIPLRALRDPSLSIICPIKLLLVQVLRSRNILSLGDALGRASRRLDRSILWAHPERPVIPQLRTSSAFAFWGLPAGVGQVNSATQQLAQVAGILARVCSHDIRRGGFREVANMSQLDSCVVGVATAAVARIGGHSRNTLAQGTTDDYVGDVETDTYTSRAEIKFQSRNAPLIGEAQKKRRLRPGDIDNYCEQTILIGRNQRLEKTKSADQYIARRKMRGSSRREIQKEPHLYHKKVNSKNPCTDSS